MVLQHVAWEGPGILATEARARGLPVDVRRLDLGAAVPSVDAIAGLVVMGGPMGVHDTGPYPYLLAEQRLLRATVERDIPVLGVCLGAQLLATALGAQVRGGTAPEIGVGEVCLTAEGLKDPVLGGDGAHLPVMHWHEDAFDLPPGAVRLAGSSLCANQGFRVGHHVYGFQFHIEVDRQLADAWAPRLPAGIVINEERRADVERVGRGIIGRFFDLALTKP